MAVKRRDAGRPGSELDEIIEKGDDLLDKVLKEVEKTDWNLVLSGKGLEDLKGQVLHNKYSGNLPYQQSLQRLVEDGLKNRREYRLQIIDSVIIDHLPRNYNALIEVIDKTIESSRRTTSLFPPESDITKAQKKL